ncbi:glycosyltransferase [Vibrio vulnificus]|uniref:glycosyltransferase n=2 Tax=Vibrio vulnificus TaxID=672 RepID=UPI0024DFFDC8|nr:glycosyltransferase [Vibrio vulnificus]MDK2646831.1 glycosyltransferase [Vibrio vulnificus]MDK2664692.1 glycosyltransferase [Vibrio vulnificus]MDK2690489.1 glycosyltransferase [Vibrio vulnificus]
MMSNFAPIAMFVYNRFDNLTEVIASLKKNPEAINTEVFIFSDGAKENSQVENVKAVREYINSLHGFKKINIIERDENLGLETNIVSGVNKVLELHDRVIVLEDDIVVSEKFLNYMNNSLKYYEDEPKVMHISGYIDPIDTSEIASDTFFIPTTSCWGWATWKDRWQYYNNDASAILNNIESRNLMSQFDFSNADVFRSQLLDNVFGVKSTWAIKWMGSVFLQGGLCLHPKYTLTKNIGFGEGATNTKIISRLYKEQKILDFHPKLSIISHEVNRKAVESLQELYCYNGESSAIKKNFLFLGKKVKRLIRDVKRKTN